MVMQLECTLVLTMLLLIHHALVQVNKHHQTCPFTWFQRDPLGRSRRLCRFARQDYARITDV